MKEIPFVSFGNEELSFLPIIKKGDKILCPTCGKKHVIEHGTSEGKESDMLQFYKCGKKSYLAGIKGKNIISSFKGAK